MVTWDRSLEAKIAAAMEHAPKTEEEVRQAVEAYARQYDPTDETSVETFLQKPFTSYSYDELKGKLAVRREAKALLKRKRGERGPQKAPTKVALSLRLSPEVVEHFRASGAGWQTRIDEVLCRYVRRRASSRLR